MEKLDCILDYYYSNKAFFLYLISIVYREKELADFILDDDYLKGAKVGTLVNLYLDIKENVVETGKGATYESKLYENELENCVNVIATPVGDKFKIDNHIFEDASTLVAKIRNKLAHGLYVIDFDSNRIVFNIDDDEVKINIDSFGTFVILLLRSMLVMQKQDSYTRTNLEFNIKDHNRVTPVKTKSEIKGIIKQYKLVTYNIKSNSGDIPQSCIERFTNCIRLYNVTHDEIIIENLRDFLQDNNCILSKKAKRIDENKVDSVCNFIMNSVDIGEIDYHQQLKEFGKIVERQIDKNPISSKVTNCANLMIIDSIKKLHTTNYQIIGNDISKINSIQQVDYDSIGVGVINMFNALFIYPFDDLYENHFEYTDHENDGLDYSKLDLSKLNISIIDPSSKAVFIEEEVNACAQKEVLKIQKNIEEKLKNRKKITKHESLEKIDNDINEKRIELSLKVTKFNESNNRLTKLREYYNANKTYYYNRATIEGIRNAIAHGNYKLECFDDYNTAKIIFTDIYNDKVTFKTEIKILDLLALLETNVSVIKEFIDNKKEKDKQYTLTK